jgi:hypothetical protein
MDSQDVMPLPRSPHFEDRLAPHRGSLILVLGILGLVLGGIGFVLGIMAWILGRNDLREMDAGRMDPSGRDTTNTGLVCGMIGTILHGAGMVISLLCCVGYFLFLGAVFTTGATQFQKTAKAMEDAQKAQQMAALADPVPNAIPQPPPPKEVPGKDTIDLIPLIDPGRDAVHGKWVVVNQALHCNDQHLLPRIEIPYEPPAQYDFIVTFSQPALRNGVSLIMPNPNGASFFWNVGENDGRGFAFSSVPPRTGEIAPVIKVNKAYTTVVKVRRGSVRCYLNGKELVNHPTDFGDLNCDNWHEIRNQRLLAVGCDDATVFHYIRLVEITGKGKRTR